VDAGATIVQFVHVAGGAAWFGGSLFANAVLLPYVLRQPPERQRDLIRGVILGPERWMIAAALTAAVTGLVRGIVFGRIDGTAVLGTSYGLVWLASIGVAIAVFAVGGRITRPAARRLRDDDGVWDGDPAARVPLLERVRVGFRAELVGITTILVLMTLLTRL
jgi:uncharacterized membrane protein